MVESAHPNWSWPVADLRLLSVTSMRVRYPGHWATPEIARKACDIADGIQRTLRPFLKEPNP